MPKYHYSGKLIDGRQVNGALRAINPDRLKGELLERGIFLESYGIARNRLLQLVIGRLKSRDITRITRQLAALVGSGITFIEALQSVREQLSDRTIAPVLDDLISSIESGKSIAASFGNFPLLFDSLYVSLLDAGEISGTLDVSLNRIAMYRERAEDVAKKIRNAMAYPLLVLAATVAVVFILVLYIIPVFASMYENFGSELPALTRNVVGASRFVQENIFLVLLVLAVLIILGCVAVLNDRARYIADALKLRVPILSQLTKKIINARFAGVLGTLLQSGVTMLRAVEVAVNSSGNRHVKDTLKGMGARLSSGKSFTETLSEYRLFLKTLIRMSSAGEKTGTLGEMLSKAADFFEHEIDHDLSVLTTLFEPVIIIFIGAFIAFILIAMYLPLFELMNAI